VRIGFGECAATVQPAAYTVVNPVAPTGA